MWMLRHRGRLSDALAAKASLLVDHLRPAPYLGWEKRDTARDVSLG